MVACNITDVVDGHILNEREYYDNLSMLQQLGVLEA